MRPAFPAFLGSLLVVLAPLEAVAADAPGTVIGAPLAEPAPQIPLWERLDADYGVGPEDVLEITVWKEEGLRKESLVRPDGGLSFPLVGDIQASGKTALEIRDEIAKLLEKYIPTPVVSVSVLRIASNKF